MTKGKVFLVFIFVGMFVQKTNSTNLPFDFDERDLKLSETVAKTHRNSNKQKKTNYSIEEGLNEKNKVIRLARSKNMKLNENKNNQVRISMKASMALNRLLEEITKKNLLNEKNKNHEHAILSSRILALISCLEKEKIKEQAKKLSTFSHILLMIQLELKVLQPIAMNPRENHFIAQLIEILDRKQSLDETRIKIFAKDKNPTERFKFTQLFVQQMITIMSDIHQSAQRLKLLLVSELHQFAQFNKSVDLVDSTRFNVDIRLYKLVELIMLIEQKYINELKDIRQRMKQNSGPKQRSLFLKMNTKEDQNGALLGISALAIANYPESKKLDRETRELKNRFDVRSQFLASQSIANTKLYLVLRNTKKFQDEIKKVKYQVNRIVNNQLEEETNV